MHDGGYIDADSYVVCTYDEDRTSLLHSATVTAETGSIYA